MHSKELEVIINVGEVAIAGNLVIPEGSVSLVIFSHGSGSSRFSPRNNYVAKMLNRDKIATLLVDLLTPEEDDIYENRFNINLLTDRLMEVTKYMKQLTETKGMRIGYFGASTGAASALMASARLGTQISAVVSRGGRPDLAAPLLHLIKSPVLLIVGSLDTQVIELNRMAYGQLHCVKRMSIVSGATHLFEEEGRLAEVSLLAKEWFLEYFTIDKYELKSKIDQV